MPDFIQGDLLDSVHQVSPPATLGVENADHDVCRNSNEVFFDAPEEFVGEKRKCSNLALFFGAVICATLIVNSEIASNLELASNVSSLIK